MKFHINFLILGSGRVGQDYGGHLKRAGYSVHFYCRQKYVSSLMRQRACIKTLNGKAFYIPVKREDIITETHALKKYDYILACFRSEQLPDLEKILAMIPDKSNSHLVICFPLWAIRVVGIVKEVVTPATANCQLPTFVKLHRGEFTFSDLGDVPASK